MEEAAAEQRDAVAHAPFLQADALADRAYELLRANLVTDALHHARQALHLDRGHLLAHKVAGACLTSSGANRDAWRHYDSLIALLRTSDCQSDPAAHAGVIDWLPNDPQLLGRAEDVVLEHVPRWTNAIGSDCLRLLELLVARQRYAAASRVVTCLLQQRPDLYLHGYRLEILYRASATGDGLPDQVNASAITDLTGYLDAPDRYLQRSELRAALLALQQGTFPSRDILTQLRRTLADRYRRWQPAIERTITQESHARDGNLAASIIASAGMAMYLAYLWRRPRWNWNTGEEFLISAVIEAVLLMWLAGAAGSRRRHCKGCRRAMASENESWAWTRSADAIASGDLAVQSAALQPNNRFGYAVLVALLVLVALGITRWYLQPDVRPSERTPTVSPIPRVVVTSRLADIHGTPSQQSAVIARALEANKLRVSGTQNDWLAVDLATMGKRGSGWVHRAFVSETQAAQRSSNDSGTRRGDFVARLQLAATRGWTFVAQVKSGQKLWIVTTGTWSGDPADAVVGAWGQPTKLCAWSECPLPGYRHSALVARVARGEPFAIEPPSSFEFTSATDGPLEMTINDHSCCLDDNRGMLDVIVLNFSPR